MVTDIIFNGCPVKKISNLMFTVAVDVLDGLASGVVTQNMVFSVLGQPFQVHLLALDLGLVADAKIGHPAIGYHNILVVQPFAISGQMRA